MEVSELLGLSRKALERAIAEAKILGGTVARGRRMLTLGGNPHHQGEARRAPLA